MKRIVDFHIPANPLLARLTHTKRVLYVGVDIACAGAILGFSIICVPLCTLTPIGIFVFCVSPLLALLTLAVILFIPVVLVLDAWRVTTPYVRDRAGELLRLTDLSESSILWSYVWASLFRCRGFLVIAVGLMPILTFFLALALFFLQTGIYNYESCITSPLGTVYCNTLIKTGASAIIAEEARLIGAGLVAAIGWLGIYVLAALTGVLIAHFLSTMPRLAFFAAALFAAVGIAAILLYIELAFSAFLDVPDHSLYRMAFNSIVFGGSPYLLIPGGIMLWHRTHRT